MEQYLMEGIIFVGVQACGKTTFYSENFFKTHIRLNLDMLRSRKRENILLTAVIKAKQPVVIDNTNPTIKERAKYITQFKRGNFNIVGYYFRSNIKECIERNNMRKGKECIPEIGIKGTYGKLELPCYSEGFNKLYYVSLNDDGFVLKEWKHEV
jgi:predicted kinase